MVKGLYASYTGMINEQKRLDIISNNVANAATYGYKRENVTTQAFDDVLAIKINDSSEAYLNRPIGSMSLGAKLGEEYTDFSQGSLRQTGNTFDIALEGKGFFGVRMVNKNGDETIRYTRDGAFKINQDGTVVDANGNALQSAGGDLVVPLDADISIDVSGVVYADQEEVDTILVTDFERYDFLEKFGNNCYTALENAVPTEVQPHIRQGYIEQSNANVVSEMIQMITITRAFEANQKAMKTIDGMLDLAVNSVGKVG